jgi:segregation and condensation protein B
MSESTQSKPEQAEAEQIQAEAVGGEPTEVRTDEIELSNVPETDVEGVGDAWENDAAPMEPADPARVLACVEAILFVSDGPISALSLAAGIGQPLDAVEAALSGLAEMYQERGAGIELRPVAGGFRLYTREDVASVVEQFLRDGQRTRLTQAALETVAVIAYRQPVTRARISAIRGVSVDGVIRTLVTRGLIVEVGTESESNATLYATTDLFLEKMGLSSLEELPSLAPLLPELDGLDVESP